MPPLRLPVISLSPNTVCRKSKAALEVCIVAPSLRQNKGWVKIKYSHLLEDTPLPPPWTQDSLDLRQNILPQHPVDNEYSNASIQGGPDVLSGVVGPVHNWKWPKNQTTTINGMEDHYLWLALALLSAPILRSPLTFDVVESGVLPVKHLNSNQLGV